MLTRVEYLFSDYHNIVKHTLRKPACFTPCVADAGLTPADRYLGYALANLKMNDPSQIDWNLFAERPDLEVQDAMIAGNSVARKVSAERGANSEAVMAYSAK